MITVQHPQLLIAAPAQPDPRFDHAVILVVSHSEHQGSMGLCLNRPTNTQVSDVIDLPHPGLDCCVYWGGAVNPTTLWMLHSTEWHCDGTVEFDDHWAMTSSWHMIHALIHGDTPRHHRLFAGHCAWAAQQLHRELTGQPPWHPAHSWLTAQPPTPAWAFDHADDLLWDAATAISSAEAVAQWL